MYKGRRVIMMLHNYFERRYSRFIVHLATQGRTEGYEEKFDSV
jgi:hypothetical protein